VTAEDKLWAEDDPGRVMPAVDGFMALPMRGCKGEEEVNPCDPDPEMLVTVSGATGTINWCGETWVLPGESGVEKSVCPETYTLDKGFTAPQYEVFWGWHEWVAYENDGAVVGDSLRLARWYVVFRDTLLTSRWERGGVPWYIGAFPNTVDGGLAELRGVKDSKRFIRFAFLGGPTTRPPVSPSSIYGAYPMGLLNGIGPAYYTSYEIQNDWFGSHVIGGITYSWARGAGWP